MKPDKSNGVVILVKVTKSVFRTFEWQHKILDEDPTFYREGQLQRRLLNCKKNVFFTDSQYNQVYPTEYKPARIYGLPKMHKTNTDCPNFRTIISSLGTFNYALATHLGEPLKKLIPTEYSCNDAYTGKHVIGLPWKELDRKFWGCQPIILLTIFSQLLKIKNQAMEFIEYINQQHPNINFTKEEKKNGKLPFLDVLINNCETLVTTVYHKPTYTGLLLNFRSFVPFSYKTSVLMV